MRVRQGSARCRRSGLGLPTRRVLQPVVVWPRWVLLPLLSLSGTPCRRVHGLIEQKSRTWSVVLRTRAGLLPRLRCGLSICYVRPPAGFTPSALLPTDAVQCRARVVSTKVSVCSRRRPSTLSTTDRILSRACKRVCRGAVCQYRMLGNVAGVN